MFILTNLLTESGQKILCDNGLDWLIVSKRFVPDQPSGSYGGGNWVPSTRGSSVVYGGKGYGIGKGISIPPTFDKKFNITVKLDAVERSVRLTVKRNLPQINIKQVDGIVRKVHIGEIEHGTAISVSNLTSGFNVSIQLTSQ